MNRLLRDILANSHVAAITIIVLGLNSLEFAFRAILQPFVPVIDFLVTAVAIWDIPTGMFGPADRLTLLSSAFYVYYSVFTFLAAVLISKWVFGVGPIRALSAYHSRIRRDKDA